MAKKSAGILVFRKVKGELEFFLVHPGGPFWVNKDEGAWSIPKGEFEDEQPLAAAIREFEEETGNNISGKFIELDPVKQKSGKMVYVWAVEGDVDEKNIISNTFDLEWPPNSGKMRQYPEVDRGGWFTAHIAFRKIIAGQSPFITQLLLKLEHQKH